MTDVYPATAPSADIVQLNSIDIDQAGSVLNRFGNPVAVGAPYGADGFERDLQVIQLGPLTVGQLGFGASVTLDAFELDGYHVTLPMIGNVHTRDAAAVRLRLPPGHSPGSARRR